MVVENSSELGDHDSDDTADYNGDEAGDDEFDVTAKVEYIFETDPNPSSGIKSRDKKRGKREHKGDSARNGRVNVGGSTSSSSNSHPSLPISTSPIKSIIPDSTKDELSQLVENLQRQMAQEHHRVLGETHRKLAQEASIHITEARDEEAWTAKMKLSQLEASAQAEAERNRMQLKELELHAQRLISEEAKPASREHMV